MTEGMRVILGAILLVLFLAVLLWPKPAPDGGLVTIGDNANGFTILNFGAGPIMTLFSKDKRGNFWMQGMPTQVGIWSGRIDADQLGIRMERFVDIPSSAHAPAFPIIVQTEGMREVQK